MQCFDSSHYILCARLCLSGFLPVFVYVSVPRYWSRIDDLIREALILRKVRVRLMISCWEETNPLTFNFIWSLKSLCMEQANCSLEAVSSAALGAIFSSTAALYQRSQHHRVFDCVCRSSSAPESRGMAV